MRKKLKSINEKANTRKFYILAGLHLGFFMWLSWSFRLINQGQSITSSLLNSIIWGIGWALPLCLVGIFKRNLKNEKNAG